MAIQIGQSEPGCNDPMGLLAACHRRVERFLKTLCAAAAQASVHDLTTEEREAIGRSLRYFREAAPNHTADEEQDLFPALVNRDPAAAAAVESLESDHVRAGELHRRVDAIGEEWIRSGRLSESELAKFREASTQLEQLYAEHIRIEETDVFPRAAQVLNEAELEAIGRRMAERRGVAFLPKSMAS